MVPRTYLSRDTRTIKGNIYWPQTPALDLYKTDHTGHFVARGNEYHVLVISHNCEIDDKPNVSRVLVAPISSIDQVKDAGARERILMQKRRAFMPLESIPKLGTCYADLRCVVYVDRKLLPNETRLASMNDEGVVRLRAQLIAYFTRLNPEHLLETLRADYAAEKQQPQG
jgi:hypothetical protein